MKYYSFKRSIMATAVAMVCASAAAEDLVKIEQIVVYGEKQTKNLQDLPASVGLLTHEQMTNTVIQDFNDVYARIANVVSLRSGNESLFAIRGLSVQGLTDNATAYTAGVYVDDVPLDQLSIRYGSMGVWDVEQIEVFRGPQGTLQGRNSLAGAIFVKTQDPTYQWGGSAQAYYGSYNAKRFSAAGGGALIDDQLALRVAIDNYNSDSYIKNVTRHEDDYAGFDRATYRAKLKFEPAALESFSALLTVSRTDNDMNDNPNARADKPYSFDAFSDNDAYHDVTTDTSSLKMRWAFSDELVLTSVSTYSKDEYDRRDDFDSSAEALGFIDQTGDSRGFSQELRLNMNGDHWSGVAGIYYADNKRDTHWYLETKYPKAAVEQTALNFMTGGEVGLDLATAQFLFGQIPTLIDTNQTYNSSFETKNIAVFGEATWQPNEQWAFTLGGRYDVEDQKRDQSNITSVDTVTGDPILDPLLGGLESFLNQGAVEPEKKTDYNAFLPKFATQYFWTDTLNTAFTVQRGYRSGGTSTNLFDGKTYNYDPEYTWNYELSLRSQWFDNRLTLNANIFYTDWKDQQVDISPSGDELDKYTGNAGKSKLYGFELESNYWLAEGIEVLANVGYVKTEFKKFTQKVGAGTTDFKGKEFPGAPNLTATLAINYRHTSGVFASADMNYQDETQLDNGNTRETNSHTLFNAKIGFEQDAWATYLWVNNLFDKEYIASSFTSNDEITSPQDVVTPGAPRMIGASVRVNF